MDFLYSSHVEHLVSAFFIRRSRILLYKYDQELSDSKKERKTKTKRPCEELVVVVNVEKCTIANIYS